MITLRNLRLQNYVVFDDINWELDKYPLTVIRGRNLDRRSHSSNACGKSLLPGAIANLINGSPPLSIRKKAAQELVHSGARADLSLSNDGVDWQLAQFAKSRTVHYDIIKDGKPQQAKTIDTARKFISEAFPLTEDHFYSQFYISSFTPSVLLAGKPAQRMDYFEQVFDLRIHDLMRRALLKELQEINSAFTRQQLLEQQREDLLPQTAKNFADRIQKIRTKHSDLLMTYQQTNKQVQDLIAYTTIAEQLDSEATPKELAARQTEITAKLHRARKRLRSAQRRWGAYKSSVKIRRSRQKLLRRLAKLPKPRDDIKSAQLDRLGERVDYLTDDIGDYLHYERHIERYHQIKNRLQPIAADPEDYQQRRNELAYQLRQRRKLHPGRRCPLCQQKIDGQDHQHGLSRLRSKIKIIEQQIARSKEWQFSQKLQQRIKPRIIDLDINDAQARRQRMEKRLRRLQHLHRQARKYRRLRQQLEQLPQTATTQPVAPRLINRLEHSIDELEEQRNGIINDLRLIDKLREIDVPYENLAAAQSALRQLQSLVSRIAPKLQAVSERMHDLSAKQSEYKIARRQLKSIDASLEELNQAVADRDVVEALASAYSAKGIRIMQVNTLTTAYVNGLNSIAPTMFPEPVKFYAEVAPNVFNLSMERHGKISDVRRTSGSESRQFLVVSALALIGLMPANLRCAQIMLDELESGVDPADRPFFTQEFLPALARTIPHVVVITPFSAKDMPIPDARELLLERKNGVSHWS